MRLSAPRLVNDILAVKRLTKLAQEDYLTEPVRNYLYDKFPPETSKIGYLISCPWCLSMWIGAGYFLLRHRYPDFTDFLSSTLTASLVSGVLSEREGI